MKEITVELDGCELILSAEKSAYDPAEAVLYIADLHAGKAATLRMHGIPVPEIMLSEDLSKLTKLIEYYAPKELIVLGDFFHARAGRLPEVFARLYEFRQLHLPLPVTIILGNHDRSTGSLPDTLQLTFEPEASIRGSFCLHHFPQEECSSRILCGHLHPAIRLPSVGTLPCFVKKKQQIILPSFGSTTGCSIVSRTEDMECFIVSEGEIFSVP